MYLNIKKRYVVILALLVLFLAGPCLAGEKAKVDINTATAEQLEKQLDRVGPKYAERIVKHREEKGKFKKPEDIMKVKGIGQKTWEANKDRIVALEPPKK